jgi:hypothetical protein
VDLIQKIHSIGLINVYGRFRAVVTVWAFCALPLLQTLGCIAEPELSEATIKCDGTADCPEGWSCKENPSGEQLCVNTSGLDADLTPPELEGNIVIDPLQGNDGTLFTLCFSANESLANQPNVSVATGGGRAVLSQLQEKPAICDQQDWAYSYTADINTDSSGPHTVTVDLVDEALNRADGLALGTIQFDFSAPSVTSAVLSTNYMGLLGTASLGLASNQPLARDPEVFMVADDTTTEVLWSLDSSTDPQQFSFSYTTNNTDIEGEYWLFARMQDEAGNLTTAPLEQSIYLDFQAPVFSTPQILPGPIVAEGTRIEIIIPTSEEMVLTLPTVSFQPASEDNLEDTAQGVDTALQFGAGTFDTSTDGNSVYFAHTVRYAECSKTVSLDNSTQIYNKELSWDLTISEGADRAGNVMEPLVIPNAITLDCLGPQLVDSCVYAPNQSSGDCSADDIPFSFRDNDQLEFDFSFSEPLSDVEGAALTLFVDDVTLFMCEDGEDADCCNFVSNTNQTAVHCSTITDTRFSDGTHFIWAMVADPWLNFETPTLGTITVDTTSPSLTAYGDQVSVGLYDTIVLTINASEPVDYTVLAGETGPFDGLDLGNPMVNDSSTQATWIAQIASDMESGSYSHTVHLSDLAGNMSSLDLGPLVIDSSDPVISQFSMNRGSQFSVQPNHNLIDLSFATTEKLCTAEDLATLSSSCIEDSFVTAIVLSAVMNCQNEGQNQDLYLYRCTLELAELHANTFQEGYTILDVIVQDGAGNVASKSETVYFDFSPPMLSDTSVSLSSQLVGLGQTLSLSVFPNELLGTPPTVMVNDTAGIADSFGLSYIDGSQYSYSYEVTLSSPHASTLLPTITLVDLVGNTVSIELNDHVFAIDNVVPSISNIVLNGALFSANPGHNRIEISFSIPESLCGDLDSNEQPSQDGGTTETGCNPSNDSEQLLVNLENGDGFSERLTCSESPNGNHWDISCSKEISSEIIGSDPSLSLTDGLALIVIETHDAANNQDTAFRSVQFDFTPPFITTPALSYIPDANNPLQQTQAARNQSHINFSFAANEFLAKGATPSVLCSDNISKELGSNTCALTGTVNTCSFEVSNLLALPDGECEITVVLSDLVDNNSESIIDSSLTFIVDNTPPDINALDFDLFQVIRAPFGASVSNGQVATIVASTALLPGEIFYQRSIPAAAFEADGQEVVSAFFFAGNVFQGATSKSNDSFPAIAMSNTDFEAVFVELVDQAGNITLPDSQDNRGIRIPRIQWHGNMNSKIPYEDTPNPLVFENRPQLASGQEAFSPEELGGLDFENGISSAPIVYRGYSFSKLGEYFSGNEHTFVSDLQGGSVVSFEREVDSNTGQSYIFACGGMGRLDHCTEKSSLTRCYRLPDPAYEADTGISYLACQDGLNVFVGSGVGTGFSDGSGGMVEVGEPSLFSLSTRLLSYDGTALYDSYSLRILEPDAGAPCTDMNNAPNLYDDHSMVYDPVIRSVVLNGGNCSKNGPPLDRLWEAQDPYTWENYLSLSTQGPTRNGAATVWDPINERAILFGGLDGSDNAKADLWMLDVGVAATVDAGMTNAYRWIKITTTGNSPSPRSHAAFAFDFRHNVAVLYGGLANETSLTDVWNFDVVTNEWTQIQVQDPEGDGNPAAARATIAYDPWTGDMRAGGADHDWIWNGRSFKRKEQINPSMEENLEGLIANSENFELRATFDELSQDIVAIAMGQTETDVSIRTLLLSADEGEQTAWESLSGPEVETISTITDGGVILQDRFALRDLVFDDSSQQTIAISPSGRIDTFKWPSKTWALAQTIIPDRIANSSFERAQAVTDEGLGHVLVFIGHDVYRLGYSSLTDRFSYTQISNFSPTLLNEANDGFSVAYDPVSDLVVLFGSIENARTGVYELSSGRYTESSFEACSETRELLGRAHPSLAWHPNIQRIVMRGGTDLAGLPLSDMWTFEGNCWLNRTIVSPNQNEVINDNSGAEMVFDKNRNLMLAFGPYSALMDFDFSTFFLNLPHDGAPGQVFKVPAAAITSNPDINLNALNLTVQSGGQLDSNSGVELLVWADRGWTFVAENGAPVGALDELHFSTNSNGGAIDSLLHNGIFHFAVRPKLAETQTDGGFIDHGSADGGVADGGEGFANNPLSGGSIQTGFVEIIIDYEIP